MQKVTFFKNYVTPDNPTYLSLFDYLEKIRDGEWEDLIHSLRRLKTPEEKKEFKRSMPTVSMSGEFSYRDDKGLITHNGILAMDIDDLDEIAMAKVSRTSREDKYVVASFVSAGGRGYRVLFSINPDKHRDTFRAICTHIYELYGEVATVDTNGINLSKPYIVSYDPHMYINQEPVVVFTKTIKEAPVKKMKDFVHTAGDFDKIIQQIKGRSLDIAPNYQDWLKVAFAISEQFGEDGRTYFHDISQFSSQYKPRNTDKQYTNCLKARGGKTVNISTFYYLCKMAGISISSEQTRKIVRYSRSGKKAGLSKLQIADNLKKFENIDGAEELVEKIFDSNEDKDEDEEDGVLHLLEMFISNNYNLVMNEVTGFLEQAGEPIPQSYLNTIFIAAKKVIPKLDYPLMMRLLKSDYIESYNPFYKFFGSDGIPYLLPAIPVEDGKVWDSPLLDKLAECIENDDPQFTLFFLRKWMVSIVSAAHKVHSPLLLCLLGGQNSGKTEFFRRLFPKELSGYYAESKLDKEKDDELLMTENLLIMDDEFGGKTKSDAMKFKNLTSKQYFSVRRPYGDHNEKILRLAVLAGTSNYYEVLVDDTGNRRIIPIEVKNVNKELYNSIDKKELFLECYKLYKEGFDWRITINDIGYLNQDKIKYQQVVKEEQLIEKYFAVGDSARVTSTDIMVEIDMLTRQKVSINIIGRQMKSLGFEFKTTREEGGKTPKKWAVIRINRTAEIFSNSNFNKPEEQEDLPF